MLAPAAIQRLIEPEEVASPAAYLCSEEASAVTWGCLDHRPALDRPLRREAGSPQGSTSPVLQRPGRKRGSSRAAPSASQVPGAVAGNVI